MAENPNTARPPRRPSRIAGYAGNIATIVAVTTALAASAEVFREIGMYKFKNEPALKDKVNGVKNHQDNLRSLVEDGEVRLQAIKGSPYNATNVKRLRKLAQEKNGIDKAVPPLETHKEYKGGGSFHATNFSSEVSRQAVVNALEVTVRDTAATKLDKEGLDDIFAQYQANLAEARGAAVQREEAAIAAGLDPLSGEFHDALNDKPIMRKYGYENNLLQDVGLVATKQGLRTADYPKERNGFTPPTDILPNTLDDAIGELYGSPSMEDLQIRLPRHPN